MSLQNTQTNSYPYPRDAAISSIRISRNSVPFRFPEEVFETNGCVRVASAIRFLVEQKISTR